MYIILLNWTYCYFPQLSDCGYTPLFFLFMFFHIHFSPGHTLWSPPRVYMSVHMCVLRFFNRQQTSARNWFAVQYKHLTMFTQSSGFCSGLMWVSLAARICMRVRYNFSCSACYPLSLFLKKNQSEGNTGTTRLGKYRGVVKSRNLFLIYIFKFPFYHYYYLYPFQLLSPYFCLPD